jgi:hypothetical protein
MSQQLSLVQFELEGETPIDETSKKIKSTYVPDEFVEFLAEKQLSIEVNIKESIGIVSDIPVIFVEDIEGTLHYIEEKLVRFIQEANEKVSGEVLVEKEIDDSYSNLLIWLKARDILKLKQHKYLEKTHIKVVVG